MDCCNYMPYRHHQPYYGSQYYDPLPTYHEDYYQRPPMYPEYYGNSPYYPQHWQCAASFPDYVYNPKEARIRKAMREATRDRSIGASPMLPRPSARRASHGWMPAHEEPLLMSPLAGMRSALDSPVCFPITPGTGNNQFMPPMNGYNKLDASPNPPPPPPTNPIHTNYLQTNSLMQQQTEMWHNYQESIRPRSSGNPYMMSDVPPYQQSPPEVGNHMMMEKHQRQTHSVGSSSMSMTPPHSNENVPPDEHPGQDKSDNPESMTFDAKQVVEGVQPLMESNSMQQHCDQFMSSPYAQNVGHQQSQFDKVEEVKMKKGSSSCPNSKNSQSNSLYLPLSCTNFCASPELFSNDTNYQKEYITKYFQNMSEYDVINVVGEDGIIFPYATYSKCPDPCDMFEDIVSQPNFIHTDVGYIPMFDNTRESVLDLTNISVKNK